MATDFNPLTRQCKETQQQIEVLVKSRAEAEAALQWHASVNESSLAERITQSEDAARQLRNEIHSLEVTIRQHSDAIRAIEPAIRTLFNPRNWFDRDQVALRRQRSGLQVSGRRATGAKQSKVQALEKTQSQIGEAVAELQRYRDVDVAKHQADLRRLESSIASKRDELTVLSEQKCRVDEVLAPLVQELRNLQARIGQSQLDLSAAETLDRRLSSAGNSYERAMIHEQCETRFGVGSPRKVIGDSQRQIRQWERDCEKAQRRIAEVAQKASRKIEAVVIDGNNMCYEASRFIGLAAIEAVLSPLAKICAVTVVFDASIRRLLNIDDSGLQGRLGACAKVHVVASRRMADETILDLAGMNERSYVISNDRFGDFNEKLVVRHGRVIRHEIVGGNIFIHDLQLRVALG
jgi:rRNA-processing protein FCF1